MNAICIRCWATDALVKMHLDGSGEFTCDACEETFTCGEVKECLEGMQKSWNKLIKWAESYPKSE